MDAELGTNLGNRYSIALLVFFIPYFLFEVPSNIVLRKVGAARWLSFLSFGWEMSILGQYSTALRCIRKLMKKDRALLIIGL
jgi:hypothetical protein